MKVLANNKTDKNVVELEIFVSPEELEEAMERAYEKEKKNITVQGFRKGKAPRKIIEKVYGNGVFIEEAVRDVYPTAYAEAVEAEGIEPVAPGDVDVTEVSLEKGLTFKAKIVVRPEVLVKDYKGLSVNKKVRAVADKDVAEELTRLQERGARLVEVCDRAAKDGDTAIIDFEGFVDGASFEGGKGENFELVLGSHSFIDTFEDQIVGKKVGDAFDVNVTFPEEYHAEDLAAKPAVFKVTLNGLKEKELPVLDDEFAKDVSEFDTLDELKVDLKQKMQERADKMADEELENELASQLIEKMEADIPDEMFEHRIDGLVREFANRLAGQGLNLETYLQYTGMDLESFRKTFREQAERQVKIQLALEAVAKLEDIAITEEDVETEYGRIAEEYRLELPQVHDLVEPKYVKQDLACGRALDIVRDSATITEVQADSKENE